MPAASTASDEHVRRLALFDGCDPWFVQEVALGTTWETYNPGEVIVREGAEDSSLWVVCRGVVEVKVHGRCAGEGGEGAHFGEAQLLGVRHRATETVRARTAVDMRMLSRNALAQVLTRYPRERALLGQAAAARKLDQFEKIQPPKGASGQWHVGDWRLRRLEQLFAHDLSPRRPVSVAGSASCSVQESQQSLSDWHRQLLCGPMGRRLHLSTLASPILVRAAADKEGFAATPQPSWRQDDPSQSLRPNSDMFGAGMSSGSHAPAQPPYPRVPRSPPLIPRRPHSVAGVVTELCGSGAPAIGGLPQCRRLAGGAPRRRPARLRRRGATAARPNSSLDGSCALSPESGTPSMEVEADCVPPGFAEAVLELSFGALRSQHQKPPPPPARLQPSRAPPWPIKQMPWRDAEHRGPAQDCFGSAPASAPSPPPMEVLLAAAAPGSRGPCCFGAFPFGAAKRLEVTLRGTFRNRQAAFDSLDDENDDEEERAIDDGGFSAALTSNFTSAEAVLEEEDGEEDYQRPPARAATAVAVRQPSDPRVEDFAWDRERMGFGRDESGSAPSGRSSVPAVRGSSSAPPIPGLGGVDEGIELEMLESRLEHHLRRLLERSLRTPSRAASCEPFVENSPEARHTCSPPRSLCPSPTPGGLRGGLSEDGMPEEMNLSVLVRLCERRCGSSSAVLELHLQHGAECSEARGCFCRPSPADAEARLLAHFGRHAQLRLTSNHPPVRVLLEPLEENGVGEENSDKAED